MCMQTDGLITFFESDEFSRLLQAPRFPSDVPNCMFPLYSGRHTTFPERWDHQARGGRRPGRCSALFRASIPDIVCFIYDLAGALGLLAPTTAVPKTWSVRIPGKGSRSRSCMQPPLMDLGTRSLGSPGHIPRSWLPQKRSHLIRSRPAW